MRRPSPTPKDLLTEIASEIATPLTVARGHAQALAAKRLPDDPDVARLRVIMGEIDEVVQTVANLLRSLDRSRQ